MLQISQNNILLYYTRSDKAYDTQGTICTLLPTTAAITLTTLTKTATHFYPFVFKPFPWYFYDWLNKHQLINQRS